MNTSLFQYISDASHGWVKVLKHEIDALGIAEQISSFSYINRHTGEVYLEEDCDAPIFLNAYKEKYGDEIRFHETHTEYWWGRDNLSLFSA